MDAIAEKYSVFDFFNLLIAGITEIVLLCMSFVVGNSCFFDTIIKINESLSRHNSIIAIIVFICCAVVIGSIIQVIGIWIIEKRIGWEKRTIEQCLENKALWNNSIRLKHIQNKARDYLQLSDEQRIYTKEICSAFFAHCVYYLHIKGADRKVEKLRETQGLSELLTCVFAIGFCENFIITIVRLYNHCDIEHMLIIVSVSACFTLFFYARYIISGKNRIKMVLSIYDVLD